MTGAGVEDVAMNWGALLGGQVAPWGIVTVVVFAILTDRLVTKARLAQALAERDAWRQAYQDEQATTTSLLAAREQEETVAKTVHHLLESIPLYGSQHPGGVPGRGHDPAS